MYGASFVGTTGTNVAARNPQPLRRALAERRIKPSPRRIAARREGPEQTRRDHRAAIDDCNHWGNAKQKEMGGRQGAGDPRECGASIVSLSILTHHPIDRNALRHTVALESRGAENPALRQYRSLFF
jgi:hypothetical protein